MSLDGGRNKEGTGHRENMCSVPSEHARWKWGFYGKPRKLRKVFGVMPWKHTKLPELASGRQRREVSRDLRQGSTAKKCGKQLEISQAIKTGAPSSGVRWHYQMSWTQFVLALISSRETAGKFPLHPRKNSHLQYSQLMFERLGE